MKRNEPATLVDVVRRWSSETPEARAFTFLAGGADGADTESDEQPLDFRELDTRARAVAAGLEERGLAGERALLVYPAGLDYITAFLGCLYASVIPVPTYPPRRSQGLHRLQAVAADCRPKVALTTARMRPELSERFGAAAHLDTVVCLDTETMGPAPEGWTPPPVAGDDVAFLQYTSGSTAEPKGVMVTHDNLLHNEAMIAEALGTRDDRTGVSWLPIYHDMGLIGNVLQAMYVGGHCVLMSPHAFLQRPFRWLSAISRYGATSSGGPNFAYELCAAKITPEQKAELDLSRWSLAFTGAEPVRSETLARFAETFASCGFRKDAFYPCYGMAETTLFVTGGSRGTPPVVRGFDPDALERHRATPSAAGDGEARELVGCGRPWMDQKVAVADPETGASLPDGHVGEIWVSGPSVAKGYWARRRQTEEAFGARLQGTGEGPFLRTGDLGFLLDGELFVTGRLKDLIIIRGTNHYPQDVEHTVEKSHEALRLAGSAAFSVDVRGEERLVLVAEVERTHQRNADLALVVEAIRTEVARHHQLKPHAVVLIKPGTLPRTSSGKTQRRRCRQQFDDGELELVAEWTESASSEIAAISA